MTDRRLVTFVMLAIPATLVTTTIDHLRLKKTPTTAASLRRPLPGHATVTVEIVMELRRQL